MAAAALLLIVWICVCRLCGFEGEIPGVEKWAGEQVSCEGSVCGIEYKKGIQYLYLDDLNIDFMQEISCSYRILARMKKTAETAYGNRVRVRGKLLLAEEPSNEGQFDSSAYQKTQRIVFTLNNAELTVLDERENGFSQTMFLCRRLCQERLGQIFDEADAGVLGAMLLGDRSGLDEQTKNWYQAGGISHVLAISGLHISMIGMTVYRFLRKTGLWFWGSAAASGALMVLYAAFTGAGTSTSRAVVMFLVFLGAQCLGRTYDLVSALSFAVILLLLSQPLLLFSAGFQLSVLAVAAIGIVCPVFERCRGKGFLAGVAVWLVLLPCILWHYYTVPLYGTVLNLAVIPMLPYVLAGGSAALLLGFFCDGAAKAVQIPVHWVLTFYRMLCQAADQLPMAQITAGKPPVLAVVGYYGILILGVWVLYAGKEKSFYSGVKKMFPFVLAAFALDLRYPDFDGLCLTFLDVGQGDCIFLENEDGVAILCDGGSSSVGKVGQYRILPFLRYHGTAKLDYVFLTHMDADHINGVQELLETEAGETEIGTLVLPGLSNPDQAYLALEDLAEERGIQVRKMRAGDRVRAGKLTLTCLHPTADFRTENRNEGSLVLHAGYGSFDALLMGDLEKGGEKYLVAGGQLEAVRGKECDSRDGAEQENRIEVLKAGHHGSAGATSGELLEILKPQLAVLSYGAGNRYGHPAPETMERLTKAGCKTLSTANCGEITIFCDKNEKITIRYGKNVIK